MNAEPAVRPAALVSAERAQALDAEAAAGWGLNPFALMEAAGRSCASALVRSVPRLFDRCNAVPHITVLAGSGNNAADALVMLRILVTQGRAVPSLSRVILSRLPAKPDEKSPLQAALCALRKLNVPVTVWDSAPSALLEEADIVIDGIAGTGLQGPLHGSALAMAEAANAVRRAFIVSIDVPSGNFDGWRPGMPLAASDVVLAVEPRKSCLYTPAARPFAGVIIPVGGIFPSALIEQYREADLFDWGSASVRVPPVPADAYKYSRGLVEIRAGSPGACGAAQLAALGAQAAGAGLVRLIVDPSLYPALAGSASGIMVVPGGTDAEDSRFTPDAVLLGPGWGRGQDRRRLLETYLPLEEQGLPLILDADALALAKDIVFHGNAILTPHAGEFAAYTGIAKDALLADPVPVLKQYARERQVYILFKSHVLYIAAPDGRIGLIDGMNPALGTGGSGDVLAGFCAAVAARQRAGPGFDGYSCAAAAAALLIEAARSKSATGKFIDPAEIAAAASVTAGRAWLPAVQYRAVQPPPGLWED
ncbi:MAG: bifunctional ADP-dependent NAD(P)H-hydrate dehydratase/NAD(P)H-hydrate epimerase [Treponema sp.]|jgi:NAD(P)H-hydrate epimerase|nr:bifunctional ADP-dependent NAD(P)H-hydrate dehydratase/NAD(P)H-hydrate epimerase [Treponema sp.]